MDRARLAAILEAFGAEPAHWPAAERAAALRLIQSDAALQAAQSAERELDRMLAFAPAGEVSDALKRKLLEAAPTPLPRPLARKREMRPRGQWLPAFGGALALRPAILMIAIVIGLGAGALVPLADTTSPDEINMLNDIWGSPSVAQTGGEW